MAALRGIGRRPTLWAELGVVAAWIALPVIMGVAHASGGSAAEPGWAGGPLWVCMAEMGGVGGGGAGHAGAVDFASLLAGVPMWLLMTVAMMVPTAMPAVRHVGGKSLYWRRRRATLEFLLVYVGIWTLFGALAFGVLASWSPTSSPYALVVALLGAALWQLTPLKRRALRACHRSRPLPPRGWRASFGVADFALHNGGACLASCWAMMLATTVAGPGRLLWMGAMSGAMTAEKLAERPRRASHRLASLLAAAAVGVSAALVFG